MTHFSRCAVFFGIAVSVLLPARFSTAAVIVINGGVAQTCYEMTQAIAKGDDPATVTVLTGSLIGLDALEICTMAVSENDLVGHDRAGTYNNRGTLYFMKSMFTEAAADFEKARSLDSNIAEVHVNHGASMIALKRWKEGVDSLDKGIALEPQEPEKAYYNRAIAQEQLGNVRGAYYDYLKAAELAPDWEQPKMQLTRFTVRHKDEPAK